MFSVDSIDPMVCGRAGCVWGESRTQLLALLCRALEDGKFSSGSPAITVDLPSRSWSGLIVPGAKEERHRSSEVAELKELSAYSPLQVEGLVL